MHGKKRKAEWSRRALLEASWVWSAGFGMCTPRHLGFKVEGVGFRVEG